MNRALLVIDVQNDFLPKGALAVAGGDVIIQPINQLMESFDWVLATKDWHPINHVSFAKTWSKKIGETVSIRGCDQKLWPVHCVENTWGSEFPKSLDSDQIHHIFYKGHARNVESYSAFFDQNHNPATSLQTFLTIHQIQELYLVGLATDYCVKATALDALELGYKIHIVLDCCKGIEEQSTQLALKEVQDKGGVLIQSYQLAKEKVGQ